jgi:hypothetical protein
MDAVKERYRLGYLCVAGRIKYVFYAKEFNVTDR